MWIQCLIFICTHCSFKSSLNFTFVMNYSQQICCLLCENFTPTQLRISILFSELAAEFLTREQIRLLTISVSIALQIRASIICTFFVSRTSRAYLLFNSLNSSSMSHLAPYSFAISFAFKTSIEYL